MLSWLRRERGQDLVEFALVLPLLLALMLGIAEFALIIFSYNTVGDAARQGARYGVVGTHATNDIAGIRAAAYQVTDAAGLTHGNVTVTPTPIGTTKIQVEVKYTMAVIAWITGSPTITLRAVSTKLIELE